MKSRKLFALRHVSRLVLRYVYFIKLYSSLNCINFILSSCSTLKLSREINLLSRSFLCCVHTKAKGHFASRYSSKFGHRIIFAHQFSSAIVCGSTRPSTGSHSVFSTSWSLLFQAPSVADQRSVWWTVSSGQCQDWLAFTTLCHTNFSTPEGGMAQISCLSCCLCDLKMSVLCHCIDFVCKLIALKKTIKTIKNSFK